MKRFMYRFYLSLVLCCLSTVAAHAQLNFNVNFAAGGGPQLVKDKFAVYQTPLAASTRLNANMSKLSEANIKHLRYEIGWGKNEALNAPQITGTADNPQYNLSEFNDFINGLKSNGVTPLYAMTYNPKPLQNNPSDYNQWQSVPNNMGAWQRICRDYAAHFKAMGTAPIYEIWNEPDLNGIFFTGNVNDYINIYKNAVAGIRAAEPTAWVGGPAVSGPNLGWFKTFLNGIGNTPITFLSGHIYNANYDQLINTMRQALNETGRSGLPLYITEYSSFNNLVGSEIDNNGIASKAQGASRFFRDVRSLLNYGDVQKVYFAQWIDPEVRDCPTCAWKGAWDKMGMIDLNNQRKALYNAFKLYGWMPVDRKAVSPEIQSGIGAMASSDDNTASVVLWNEGGTQQSVSTTFNNLPFSSGKMEIYRIDAGNASKYDGAGENLTVLSTSNITSNTASLNTTVPGNGVVFVKMYRTNTPPSTTQTPYAGVIGIPGTIEAENYDKGGEGVAYHDTEASNLGGVYRTAEGVDIQSCTEGGYNIGWSNAGEWLEYTINVASAGSYQLQVRVATPNNAGSLHVEMNGSNVTGSIAVPNTAGWQSWQTVSKTVNLSAGQQVMRVVIEQGGFNLNKLTFTSQAGNTGIISGQVYRLVARHSGKVLDVSECSTADGANVQQWPWLGGNCQRWKVESTDNGYYRLLSQQSGKALEVDECSNTDGANVQQWPYWAGNCQQWKIEATDNGYYRLVSRQSGKVLDVSDCSSADGANVQQWRWLGGGCQQWKFEEVAATASSMMASSSSKEAAQGLEVVSRVGLYPNPADEEATLSIPEVKGEQVSITIVDMTGRKIRQKKVKASGSVKVNTATLKAGVYTLIVQTQHKTINQQLIVKH